jgi:hypothetical protein
MLSTRPTTLAVRMMGMTHILGLLALAALIVAAPVKVMMPLATVLVLGLVIGGLFAVLDRHRSRTRVMGGVGSAFPPRVLGRVR